MQRRPEAEPETPTAAYERFEAIFSDVQPPFAFVDLDARMSFSYVPNKWITGGYEQERGRRLLQAVYSAMQVAAR